MRQKKEKKNKYRYTYIEKGFHFVHFGCDSNGSNEPKEFNYNSIEQM